MTRFHSLVITETTPIPSIFIASFNWSSPRLSFFWNYLHSCRFTSFISDSVPCNILNWKLPQFLSCSPLSWNDYDPKDLTDWKHHPFLSIFTAFMKWPFPKWSNMLKTSTSHAISHLLLSTLTVGERNWNLPSSPLDSPLYNIFWYRSCATFFWNDFVEGNLVH